MALECALAMPEAAAALANPLFFASGAGSAPFCLSFAETTVAAGLGGLLDLVEGTEALLRFSLGG